MNFDLSQAATTRLTTEQTTALLTKTANSFCCFLVKLILKTCEKGIPNLGNI